MVGDVLVGGAGASGETVIVSRHPSRVWQRAAVYGSLWAAVEIVVGSFLHNLRIPLAGMILSAFGVTVMTAGHRAFPERGLIWRAALICALMKSISPSAVILGPMIGIAMEGVLLETSVRLLGGHAVGYLVGGALAVSWTLAQRILNAVIAFGPDVVRLYVETYNFASRSLGVSRFGPFDLIATLVVAEWAFGVAAAGFGLRVGRNAGAAPAAPGRPSSALAFAGAHRSSAEGEWSVRRLALTSAALLVGMVGLALVPVGGRRLRGRLRRLRAAHVPAGGRRIRRPSLWIEMAFVMLLAGALLGGARAGFPAWRAARARGPPWCSGRRWCCSGSRRSRSSSATRPSCRGSSAAASVASRMRWGPRSERCRRSPPRSRNDAGSGATPPASSPAWFSWLMGS